MVILAGQRLGVRELACLVESAVPDVANGGDADARDLCQRLHQAATAPARADAADLQRLIRRIAGARARESRGHQAGGRAANHLAAVLQCVGHVWLLVWLRVAGSVVWQRRNGGSVVRAG